MSVLSKKDEQFIDVATEEAKKSQVAMQHGCVAVINGTIMAKGHNSYRTYSKDQFINNTCTCHAEIATLRNLYHNCCTNTFGKFTDAIKVG